jgi:uncharacterized membrane protein (GlpM family)
MSLVETAALLASTPIPGDRKMLLGCFAVLVAAMFAGTRRGYWRGPLRQLAPTFALLVAGAVAWLCGAAFGHWALKTTLVPWLLRGLIGALLLGAVVWLAVFAFAWRFGRSRFPNHLGEAESPVLGALVGCWTAILWTTAGFLLLCAAAAVGQFWLNNTHGESGPVRTAVTQLVRVKNSLALVRGCGWLRNWNPLPRKVRRTLEKGILVVNTPGAQRRLSRLQPVRALATHPAFFPLRENEEIRELAFRKRDVEGLLAHPLVLRMLADEDFQRLLAGVDLEAFFDEALAATYPADADATGAGDATTHQEALPSQDADAATAPPAP